MKHLRFERELANRILSFIRAGGYPHIAAEALGVPRESWLRWLQLGDRPGAREPYRTFAREVRQAAALCRLMAEAGVYKKDTRFWLAHGPGKEGVENPGWSSEPKPIDQAPPEEMSLLEHPQWQDLSHSIMEVLADFPDAKLALAQSLREEKKAKKRN